MPISWMCKKQTSVSHSSAEAEIISHDAGLRMDGILALDLWDLVIEVFISFFTKPNQQNQRCKREREREPRRNLSANTQLNMRKQIPSTLIKIQGTFITCHQTEHISGSSGTLFVFEDN